MITTVPDIHASALPETPAISGYVGAPGLDNHPGGLIWGADGLEDGVRQIRDTATHPPGCSRCMNSNAASPVNQESSRGSPPKSIPTGDRKTKPRFDEFLGDADAWISAL